jgi:hypothetical protein
MAKIPKSPEEIFPAIADDFKKIFGDDLLSIELYGSGAMGDYIPGKSDINFLMILTHEGIDCLDRAVDTVNRWQKRKVAVPLFMTEEEVLSSLDSYPIEFLMMKTHHVTVYGSDILEGISIETCALRLQCERELKGKIYHLRSGLMETEGRARRIRELIRISLNAFISVFRALLYLKALDIPHGKRQVIQSTAQAYSIDPAIFVKCADIKEGIDHIPNSDIPGVFNTYLKEVGKLSRIVDRLEI